MRGYFGIGVENTKVQANIGTLWRTAHILGASYIFTINRRYRKQHADTSRAWRHIPLFHFDTLEDFRNCIPRQCAIVGVELCDTATPLSRFTHPERCVYLLGAEDRGLSSEAVDACESMVILPGRFSFNVAVAGSIVIYDRFTKGNK